MNTLNRRCYRRLGQKIYKSAVMIQNKFRGMKAKRELESRKMIKQTKAALLMQRFIRRLQAQKFYQKKL